MSKIKHKLLFSILILVGLAWFYIIVYTFTVPSVISLKWSNPETSAYMDGCNSNLRYKFVPLNKISIHMQNAVRIAEDSRFFEHNGIDYEALKEAIKKDWERKEFAFGASTITMQLARNLFLEPDKSIGRKLREMIITYKLERTLSKKRILELYLNVVQFGNCIYGVEEAAIHYFGKSASRLNRYESAFLAALLPKPAYYQKHPDGKFFNSRIDFIVDKL